MTPTIAPLRLDALLSDAGIRHYGVDFDGQQYAVTTFDAAPYDLRRVLPIGDLEFNKQPDSLCWEIYFTLEV